MSSPGQARRCQFKEKRAEGKQADLMAFVDFTLY